MTASFSSQTYTPDALIACDSGDLISRSITLVSGQNLARGAVIGKITASGKYMLSLSAAADGSQTPDLILAEAANATAGDVPAIAYAAGQFLESHLTIGAGHTADSIREGLRVKGIHLIKSNP
jgi:hypothetical protein